LCPSCGRNFMAPAASADTSMPLSTGEHSPVGSSPHSIRVFGSYKDSTNPFRLTGAGWLEIAPDEIRFHAVELLWYRWLLFFGIGMALMLIASLPGPVVKLGPLGMILLWYPIRKLKGKAVTRAQPKDAVSLDRIRKNSAVLTIRTGKLLAKTLVFSLNEASDSDILKNGLRSS